MTLEDFLAFLFFPNKCALCDRLLPMGEREICQSCQAETEEILHFEKLPYLHKWAALWYYEGNVRESIIRFKFKDETGYSETYGRLLAEKLRREGLAEGDFVLSYIPVSRQRKLRRGYDQCELLVKALAKELDCPFSETLYKQRNNKPQHSLATYPERRANVLGVYRAVSPNAFRGRRVLLLDDVKTTGATAEEAAKVLLTAGAKQVDGAFLAARRPKQEKKKK